MRYYAGFDEAFHYAYTHGSTPFTPSHLVDVTELVDPVTRLDSIRQIERLNKGLGLPLPEAPGIIRPQLAPCHHVLVPRSYPHRPVADLRRHCWDAPIPPGSFAMIGAGIYVSTPAFVFLQLARELSFIELVLVGCSLCSSYYIDPESGAIRRRPPIASVEALSSFLDGAYRSHGLPKARKALEYVAEGAESPQEVNLYLMLALPVEFGGMGIEGIKLNYEIAVSSKDAAVIDRAERKTFRIDMGVPGQHAGVEYLGRHHEQQVDADRERLNALMAIGERTLQVKFDDLVNPVKSDRLVSQFARLVGQGAPQLSAAQQVARQQLLGILFGPGRPRL